MDLQSRSRTNAFLDKMNDEFYRPRGLYCLVMTWSPESSETSSTIDLTSTIFAKSHSNNNKGASKLAKKFSNSSGKSYANMEIPEVAPLIYPALDKLAEQQGEDAVRKRDKLKKKANFVDDYWDKRAQAKYVSDPFRSSVSPLMTISLQDRQASGQCLGSDSEANIYISLCGSEPPSEQWVNNITPHRRVYQPSTYATKTRHGRGPYGTTWRRWGLLIWMLWRPKWRVRERTTNGWQKSKWRRDATAAKWGYRRTGLHAGTSSRRHVRWTRNEHAEGLWRRQREGRYENGNGPIRPSPSHPRNGDQKVAEEGESSGCFLMARQHD